MNWNQFIAQYPRGRKTFLEIGQKRIVDVNLTPPALSFVTDFSKASKLVMDYVPHMAANEANTAETLVLSRVLADGPKIFRPTQLELELMEEMSVNLTITEYVQPFETVVIELPTDYVKNKKIACPQAGEHHYGQLMPADHEPVIVLLHHRPEHQALLTMVIFGSQQSIKTCFVPKEEDLLEKHLVRSSTPQMLPFENTQYATPEELKVSENVLRACLNYCLLLDEVGVKSLGVQNPAYKKRLERYLQVAQKMKDKRKAEDTEGELKTLPIYFEIKQHVKLYRTVKCSSELPEETGMVLRPHHRRGHYKMQPHGPGNTLRKRKRIKPVFVNKHFFFGDDSDTEVTYE